MQNGVVPHRAAREMYTNVMTELGNLSGDSRMFEVPAGATAEDAGKFIRDRAKQMPGLVGRITPGFMQAMNDKFWRGVFLFQVFAYHVEQRALRARFPDMREARVNAYAAFRANRWGGAIEPENWNSFAHHSSRLLAFAPNWLRSYLELNITIYLKGELGASQGAAALPVGARGPHGGGVHGWPADHRQRAQLPAQRQVDLSEPTAEPQPDRDRPALACGPRRLRGDEGNRPVV